MNLGIPYALGVVVALALVVAFLLIRLLKKSAKVSRISDEPEGAEELTREQEITKPSSGEGLVVSLPEAFARARELLDRVGDGDPHHIPLFLLVGAERSRDTDLLANCGSDLPWSTPADAGTSLGNGRGFWVFERGVVLDVAGDYILREDGTTADDKSWSELVGLLRELRPRRPVDGVIVTLPCADLASASADEVLRAQLAERTGRIFRRLWDAQQRLGFRLPTFVLITGSERLDGFESLCASLPSAGLDQILGWSTPYSLDSAYRSRWIEEAFALLNSRLQTVQLEVFTEGARDPDALLRLSASVLSVAAAVRSCFENLFRSSAYHNALMFRGLYFCGRFAPPEMEGRPRTAFLREVLEKKVFPEFSVASPTTRTVVARNRAVRTAQIAASVAAVVLTGGLVWSNAALRQQNEALRPFLESSIRYLRVHRQKQADREPMTQRDLAASAGELLDEVSAINFPRYSSAFIPGSWLSTFESDLSRSLSESFQGLILKAIRLQLEERARSAIANATPPRTPFVSSSGSPRASLSAFTPPSFLSLAETRGGEGSGLPEIEAEERGSSSAIVDPTSPFPSAPILSIQQMPEFIAFRQYVSRLKAVDENGRIFNDLSTSGDLKELEQVFAFAFDRHLPPSFVTRGELYQKALLSANYQRFDPARFNTEATQRAEELAANFYAALYRRNPFLTRLQHLGAALQRVSWRGGAPGDVEAFADVARRLREIDQALAGPELDWAFRPRFDLGREFSSVVNDIDRSKFLGPAVASKIVDAGSTEWADFRNELATTTSPVTGTILSVRNDNAEMRLSGDTLLLKYALDTFLGQGFLTANIPVRRVRLQAVPGSSLSWKAPALERAAAVSLAYDRFREKSLDLFPADLRTPIDQVARYRAAAEMSSLLAEAQTYQDLAPATSAAMLEQDLRSQIASFLACVKPMAGIVDALSRLGSPESQRDVSNAMTAEAFRLLQVVDRLLAADQPYTPRHGGFAWWDGSSSPSPSAWGAKDPAEVAVYLHRTRGDLGTLAQNYAEPLLLWLNRNGSMEKPEIRELALKWQSILDDLREYDAKKPGNSVAVLEDYITARMPKVSALDCSAAALPAAAARRPAYFDATLDGLSRQLSQRCLALAAVEATARYESISRYFNQRLADRYPFADAPKGGTPEADPADIRAFYRLVESGRAVIEATASDGDAAASFAAARRFIGQAVTARAFFAPFLDAQKPELMPSYDVEATFRVLRQKEVGGDEIIVWSFGVGDESVSNHDTKTKLRWTPGKPVRFVLRWAAQSPRIPVAARAAAASVRDRGVEYEYTNRWSLLSALADHAVPAELLPAYADSEPVTLGFDVFTRPVSGGSQESIPAQVFLRLAVLAPGTTQSVDVPKFPTRAPRIEAKKNVAEQTR